MDDTSDEIDNGILAYEVQEVITSRDEFTVLLGVRDDGRGG